MFEKSLQKIILRKDEKLLKITVILALIAEYNRLNEDLHEKDLKLLNLFHANPHLIYFLSLKMKTLTLT